LELESGTTIVASSAYLMNVLPADTQWRSEEFMMYSEGPSAEPWTTLELMPREEEVTDRVPLVECGRFKRLDSFCLLLLFCGNIIFVLILVSDFKCV